MLNSIGIKDSGFLQVTRAYDNAKKYIRERERKWKKIYLESLLIARIFILCCWVVLIPYCRLK